MDYVSNEEIVQAARKHWTQAQWDHVSGGSESETTMRRNRLAFDRWAFRPRILVDVSKIDTSSTFLGQKMRLPVILGAPRRRLRAGAQQGAGPGRVRLRHRRGAELGQPALAGGDRADRRLPQGLPALRQRRPALDQGDRRPDQGGGLHRPLDHGRRGDLQPSRASDAGRAEPQPGHELAGGADLGQAGPDQGDVGRHAAAQGRRHGRGR